MTLRAVIGLGFGDEGKGATVDFLCRESRPDYVVRFNGGPQALHNVVTPDGIHHGFAQFGSGTFVEVPTFLSHFMIVEPKSLRVEADALESLGVANPMGLMDIDGRAPLLTYLHRDLCRAREVMRGNKRHGSTGVGISEVMRFRDYRPLFILRVYDLYNTNSFLRKMSLLCEWVNSELALLGIDERWSYDTEIANAYRMELREELVGARIINNIEQRREILGGDNLVFEGAQGVLLDETYGFAPYTTWSTTTFTNAKTLLFEENNRHPVQRIGCIRSYYTRHGVGPFPTEDSSIEFEDAHNKSHEWMGNFRNGHFDLVLFSYALNVCGGVDYVSVSHMDRTTNKVCQAYVSHRNHNTVALRMDEDRDFNSIIARMAVTTQYMIDELTPSYVHRDADFFSQINDFEVMNRRAKIGILGYGPTAVDRHRVNES